MYWKQQKNQQLNNFYIPYPMKLHTLLGHTNKRINIKLLMLLLVMIVGYGIHPVFAQTTTADTSYLDGLAKVIDDLMKVASRAWIPLATLAGKFMSNDMIYGNRLHLDAYLWQMRNISKNFANFGIL